MVRIIVNYIQKDQRQGQKFRHQLEVYGLLPRLVEITHNWIQFSVLITKFGFCFPTLFYWRTSNWKQSYRKMHNSKKMREGLICRTIYHSLKTLGFNPLRHDEKITIHLFSFLKFTNIFLIYSSDTFLKTMTNSAKTWIGSHPARSDTSLFKIAIPLEPHKAVLG